MEIDPKKIDFGKMRPYENIENNTGDNEAGESLESNPSPSLRPPSSPTSVQNLSSLPSPTALLSEAWQLYKSRFKTFLGVMIFSVLLIIFTFAAIFAAGVLGTGFLGSLILSPESAANNVIIFFLGLILLLILLLGIIVIQFWGQSALIFAIKDSGENIGIKESYRRGWHKIFPFFLVSLLSGLIIFGGFVFFIIPGIIFSVWFYFAVFVVIAEDLGVMNALLKSREYVRNYWWPVFWRSLFIALIVFLVITIALLILGIALAFLNVGSIDKILDIASNIISFVLVPLAATYSFLIYKHLREIKGDFEFASSKKSKTSFILVGALGILTIIIVSFFVFSIVSSNLDNARSKVMDVARRSDLSSIQFGLLVYYGDKKEYPKSLSELGVDYTDPETKKPYEYRRLDNGDDYEICVQFKEKGKKCFSSEDSFSAGLYNINKNTNKNLIIVKRDKRRVSDLNSISYMLLRYKEQNGSYPVSPSVVRLDQDNEITREIKSANHNMDIPVDPDSPEYYYGYKSTDGKSYELSAVLEDKNDSRCRLEGNLCIYRIKQSNGSSKVNSIHQSIKKDDFSYELYLPTNYSEDNFYPVFLCLSPSGGGSQFYSRVYPAANESGWIMACSNDFRNNVSFDEYLPKIRKMISDVNNRIKVSKMYIGGFSGGGMGSYVISYFNPVFSGLIVNSGAIHQNLYNKNEIKKIKAKKIVLICGERDSVVPCSYMGQDEKFLNSAGFETLLLKFKGSHEIAPTEMYRTAFKWF
jgi:predicted esterase